MKRSAMKGSTSKMVHHNNLRRQGCVWTLISKSRSPGKSGWPEGLKLSAVSETSEAQTFGPYVNLCSHYCPHLVMNVYSMQTVQTIISRVLLDSSLIWVSLHWDPTGIHTLEPLKNFSINQFAHCWCFLEFLKQYWQKCCMMSCITDSNSWLW
jgi:hypothetical protein